jgi:HSP20 family protein
MYGKNFNEILKEILKDDFFVSSTTFRSDDLKQKMNNVKKNKENNSKFSHNLPVTNIYEDGWSFRYELLTPGFTKKGINVSIENGSLLVEGERKTDKKLEEGSYISKEYHSTNFNRSFTLPDNIVCEEIHAKVENGITTIFFPKEKKSNPKTHNRKITVD